MLSLGGNAPFLYISTAYVCGTRNGFIAEASCAPDTQFSNGYERSKAAAEALVERSGRPWLIARPSIVVGASTNGRIRRFDSIYGAFKLLAEGRITTLPATVDASLNFVPINHVAEAIAALATNPSEFAGDYVHICAERSLSVAAFVEAIGAAPALKAPRLVAPEAFDKASLLKIEKLLFERILEHYLPYFQHNPEFALGNVKRLTGLQSPSFNLELLHVLIGYAIDAGFVRPVAA